MATASVSALDVRADFPILAPRDRRAPAGLPRLGRHLAEAAARDRRAWTTTTAATTRTSTAASTRSRRRPTRPVRGRARARRRVRRLAEPTTTIFTRNVTEAINLVAYAWGREQRRPRRRGADHRRWSTTPTSCPGSCSAARPARAALPGGRRATASSRSTQLDARARPRRRQARRASRTSRTCSARSTRSPRSSARARAAGALVARSTAPRPCRRCRSTCRDRRRLLRAGPATRRSARPASACCTAAASCSRQMRAVPRRRRHDRARSTSSSSTWNELPWKFEAGTSMIAEAVGLGAAVDYLDALGHGARARARARADRYALERLADARRASRVDRPAERRRPRRRRLVRARRHPPPRRRPSCSAARTSASAPATTARSR